MNINKKIKIKKKNIFIHIIFLLRKALLWIVIYNCFFFIKLSYFECICTDINFNARWKWWTLKNNIFFKKKKKHFYAYHIFIDKSSFMNIVI